VEQKFKKKWSKKILCLLPKNLYLLYEKYIVYYYNMNTIQKRFLLFLIGCIGTRTLFVYLAKIANKTYLQYMGYLSIFPAIGFFYLFLSGSRKTGAEVFGDKIWWNNLRPIHGLMYFLFAYNAINGNSFAWIYLLIDVIIGIVSFLSFHYYNNDFEKLYM